MQSGRAMKCFGVLCLGAAAAGLASGALAQAYPSKPIRIVVPFPPGGTSDILARTLGQKLTEDWGQQVVVDNRAGAGANIGAENVAKSAPDGYSLLILSTAHTINPSLYSKLAYDTVRDFTPITMLVSTSQVLVVHNSVPVKTVRDFIAFAKKHPGELLYSSAGSGSQPHLSAEMFKTMTGISIVHVPYKGAPPAMIDLLAGHVALTFATAPSAVPYVKAGQLRALGVSTLKRIAALPQVPTIAEAGVPGYEAAGWNGLAGPAGMPSAVVDKLNAEFVKILRTPAVASYLSGQGADPDPGTAADFAAYIKSEIVKWAKVVKDSGARVD
ncbi:MAG TPA: tripartite tricarboxylate transporter substrate binding protein [Burkholderiales bacterium]|nr:tripartite tricarboxylate transporter substrate binding protein [Burkholderiales bacterium]